MRQNMRVMKERAFMVRQESQQPAITGNPHPGTTETAGPTAARDGFWARLTASLRGWFEVPFGYEDEQGFHYGQQPTPKFAAEGASFRARVLTDRAEHVMRHSVILPVANAEEKPLEPATHKKIAVIAPH